MSDKIARPYAAAAFSYAKENGNVKLWSNLLTTLAESQENLQSAIGSHAVGGMQIAEVLIEALAITDIGQQNFLRLLTQHQRWQTIASIAARFEQLQLQDEGVSVVRVETASPMDETARHHFDMFLERWCESKIKSTYEETPDLLGGVRVYVQDNVLDASIRGRMNRLTAALS